MRVIKVVEKYCVCTLENGHPSVKDSRVPVASSEEVNFPSSSWPRFPLNGQEN